MVYLLRRKKLQTPYIYLFIYFNFIYVLTYQTCFLKK